VNNASGIIVGKYWREKRFVHTDDLMDMGDERVWKGSDGKKWETVSERTFGLANARGEVKRFRRFANTADTDGAKFERDFVNTNIRRVRRNRLRANKRGPS